MILSVIYLLSPLVLVLLLISRKKESKRGIWVFKPALSLAFVLCAALSVQDWDVFALLMLCGFFLCFTGDIFLIPQNKKMFIFGLGSFLLGHLFYLSAFVRLAIYNKILIVVVVTLLVIVVGVMRWLRSHLQDMLVPVVCYMLVISCMVVAACALAFNTQISLPGRSLIVAGAICFFLSDLFVVRQRFVSKSFLNPLLGLPLYYVAQFALAISLAYIN